MLEKPRVRRAKLLFLALLCGILLTACNRDPNVRKQKFFDSAQTLLKKGKIPEAALELRNALQIDPNFAEAADILAEIDFRLKNYGEAYNLLLQAKQAKPDYLPARKDLAQLYRLSGKLAEAEVEAEYILEHSPDDIDELLNLGIVQAAQKKPTEAEGTLSRILELQPNHVQALLALATLKNSVRDSPGAERYLKLALERNPRSITVYMALLKFYIANGRGADAEPLFAQALKVSNNRMEVLEAQLGYYEGSNKLAEAEAVARKIQSFSTVDPQYLGALADYYVRISDWARAKAELERVLQQRKDDANIIHKLVEVHLNLNDRKTAEELNEALLKRNPKDSIAHLFKGRFYLAQGDLQKAMEQFNQTQEFLPNLPALHYWYAQVYLQRGDIEQAKQSLDRALKEDPNYQAARLDLADLQNRAGTPDAALANARRLLLTNPGDVRGMLIYSQALISKKEYAQADKVLKVVVQRAPASAEVHRQIGIVSLANKNLPAARKEFSQAWSLQPGSTPLLETVLAGYLAAKQTGEAVDFLQKQIEARPQDALLYHQLGQVYLLLNKRAEAIAALKKAESLAPSATDSSFLLADVYAAGKERDQAIQIVTDLMQKHPQNPGVLLGAALIFEKVERWQDARKAYENVLQLDTGNALAKNNLASLLVDHDGNIDVALGLAQQAKEKLVDNLQVTNTIGWIYYQKHAYKMALNYLKECAEKDTKNATFQYQLGMTYSMLGEKDAARRTLLNALALDSHFPQAQTARETLAHL